jgi:hypothetical protein
MYGKNGEEKEKSMNCWKSLFHKKENKRKSKNKCENVSKQTSNDNKKETKLENNENKSMYLFV